ncbi:MAG: CSLREA domain-containing protein [Anaerolineae bacterium]|nr:CSLREA domain-containing protein [Anaerolineae bacterium]
MILEPLPAQAATITVDTLTDEDDGSCTDGDCSLRDAIAVAAAGDAIDFSVTGTITLTLGQLTVDKDLVIEGPGAGNLMISGADATRIFWINEDITATLAELTITHGYEQDGGGIFNCGGNLTLDSCTVSDNDARYDGGGVSNRLGGVLYVVNSIFSGNTGRHGGAIDNRDTLMVSDSTFTGNSGGTWGGAIYNYTGAVTVTNSTFTENGEYVDNGGGICNHQGTLDVRGSAFFTNTARLSGGGIYNEDVATMTNCDFLGNTSARGGGLVNNSLLTVASSTFTNNSVAVNGGGIHNTYVLTVTHSTFYSNTGKYGGGIENFSHLTLDSTTFYSNTAEDTGGGICSHGALTVTNSTFYSNAAGARGGGINNNNGTLYETNGTFVDNRAGDNGGNIRNEETATLINTIMVHDPAGDNCAGNALEVASTHGLTTDGTCAPGFTQTTRPELALNWEGWVFELLAGSVAIDAGTNIGCPAVDQLGQPRPQDGDGNGVATCDAGAYELSVMDQVVYLPLLVRN